MSTSWLIRLLRNPTMRGSVAVKELLEFPIHKWSYSTPKDQFGEKPYSKPTPRVPPQRVALDVTRPVPVTVSDMVKLLLVTAAPPLR